MEKNEILSQVNSIFNTILDRSDLILTYTTSANDVDGWDSLTHIHLVVAMEKHFKIRFTSKEIQSWKNIGELITCIQSKNV